MNILLHISGRQASSVSLSCSSCCCDSPAAAVSRDIMHQRSFPHPHSPCVCCCRSVAGKQCAFTLATTLDAVTALQQVCQQEASPASASLPGSPAAKASTQEALQALCEQSVSPTGRKAVAVAISNVPGALHRLMGLLQVNLRLLGLIWPANVAHDSHASEQYNRLAERL